MTATVMTSVISIVAQTRALNGPGHRARLSKASPARRATRTGRTRSISTRSPDRRADLATRIGDPPATPRGTLSRSRRRSTRSISLPPTASAASQIHALARGARGHRAGESHFRWPDWHRQNAPRDRARRRGHEAETAGALYARCSTSSDSSSKPATPEEPTRLQQRLLRVDAPIVDELGFVLFDRHGGELLSTRRTRPTTTSDARNRRQRRISPLPNGSSVFAGDE